MISKKTRKAIQLNDRNEKTKGVIHLMVTSLCNRHCKYCCNRFYSLDDVPQVTDEELKEAHTVCITGGEPVVYSNPVAIAEWLKEHYSNIKRVILYANAEELYEYFEDGHSIRDEIDGLSVSVKTIDDKFAFEDIVEKYWYKLPTSKNNRCYVFNKKLMPDIVRGYFTVTEREWQKEFVPADDSIFRRI
jgi:MoaA/NifB/PqqE/SkfB family radical SAM enzyme